MLVLYGNYHIFVYGRHVSKFEYLKHAFLTSVTDRTRKKSSKVTDSPADLEKDHERKNRRDWWNSLSYYSASALTRLHIVIHCCCCKTKKIRLLNKADEKVKRHLDVAR